MTGNDRLKEGNFRFDFSFLKWGFTAEMRRREIEPPRRQEEEED
jgi:hypothetical protein